MSRPAFLSIMVEARETRIIAFKFVEVVSLVLVTLTEIVVFITSGLASSSNASRYGFLNRTGAISVLRLGTGSPYKLKVYYL